MCIVVNKAFARVYLWESLEIIWIFFFFCLNQALQPDKKLNIDYANFDKLYFYLQLFYYNKHKLPSFLSVSK